MSNTESENRNPGGGMGASDDPGAGENAATTDFGAEGGPGAHSGLPGASPDAAAASTDAGDMGAGIGEDDDYDDELATQPEPQKGIAGQAAEESTHEDDADNPSRVPGETEDASTPGHSP
ncbi:MAG: hypothetical protein WKH64_16500 [Chloroflexia bacterium]